MNESSHQKWLAKEQIIFITVVARNEVFE